MTRLLHVMAPITPYLVEEISGHAKGTEEKLSLNALKWNEEVCCGLSSQCLKVVMLTVLHLLDALYFYLSRTLRSGWMKRLRRR